MVRKGETKKVLTVKVLIYFNKKDFMTRLFFKSTGRH
jgi:hypothetical protein